MSVTEIAAGIDLHLKRFAATPEIARPAGRTRFWNACAYRSGRYVSVRYISYQGSTCLPRQQAQDYLDWLNEGNIGRHYGVPDTSATQERAHGTKSED